MNDFNGKQKLRIKRFLSGALNIYAHLKTRASKAHTHITYDKVVIIISYRNTRSKALISGYPPAPLLPYMYLTNRTPRMCRATAFSSYTKQKIFHFHGSGIRILLFSSSLTSWFIIYLYVTAGWYAERRNHFPFHSYLILLTLLFCLINRKPIVFFCIFPFFMSFCSDTVDKDLVYAAEYRRNAGTDAVPRFGDIISLARGRLERNDKENR